MGYESPLEPKHVPQRTTGEKYDFLDSPDSIWPDFKDSLFKHHLRNFRNHKKPEPNFNQLIDWLKQVVVVYKSVGFKDPSIISIACELIRHSIAQSKTEIIVTRSDDDEILIYRILENEYSNLLIDDEGDIKFIYVGSNLGRARSQVFYKEDGFNFQDIVKLF